MTMQRDDIDDQLSQGGASVVPAANGYAGVRYNAMKHGILSRLAVLPHESEAEFGGLLQALIEEHRPEAMTEKHLVEELAAIMWRKRRVLLAEGSRINDGLRIAVSNTSMVMASAVPLESGFNSDTVDLADLLTATAEELTERKRDAELDLAAVRRAASILRAGGSEAYEKARDALTPDLQGWWNDYVEDDEYPATAEALAEFIREHLDRICTSNLQLLRFAPAIKAHTLGESVQVYRLEKLNRYETHLDRKFERTLAMLLKLKELRNSAEQPRRDAVEG